MAIAESISSRRTSPGSNLLPTDYANTALPHLVALLENAQQEVAAAQRVVDQIQSAISDRVRDAVTAARVELQKFEGTVRVVVEGCEVKSDVPKRVEWDSAKLLEAGEEISRLGEDPSRFIDIKCSISERKFEVLPRVISALVSDARTVKHGKERLDVTVVEG